jgi:hypothetical protein
LRWGRSREHQFVTFLGGGSVRFIRFHCFWHHAAEFDDGAVAVWALLLRDVCRRSLCCGMGDGADSAVVAVVNACWF